MRPALTLETGRRLPVHVALCELDGETAEVSGAEADPLEREGLYAGPIYEDELTHLLPDPTAAEPTEQADANKPHNTYKRDPGREPL